jgi:hypothetical protein
MNRREMQEEVRTEKNRGKGASNNIIKKVINEV